MAGRAPRPPRSIPVGVTAGADGHQVRSVRRRRFAVVAARFNESITSRLVDGARHALASARVPADDVEVHWVPGSFELPLAAACLAATGRYRGIICVGVVIRGETPHFEHVAREAAAGIRQVAMASGVPTTFGVITALDEPQAWARAGGAVGNRGEEAAEAALEMAAFLERVRNGNARNPLAGRPDSRATGSRSRRARSRRV